VHHEAAVRHLLAGVVVAVGADVLSAWTYFVPLRDTPTQRPAWLALERYDTRALCEDVRVGVAERLDRERADDAARTAAHGARCTADGAPPAR